MLLHSGNEKQLFTNMTVNVFVPIDPTLLNSSFKINDVLDDEPEKLERLQYFVSLKQIFSIHFLTTYFFE